MPAQANPATPVEERDAPKASTIAVDQRPEADESGELVHDVAPVMELEERHRASEAASHRVAALLTRLYSSAAFAVIQVAWIGGWIAINLGWLGIRPFDPFPFSLLSVIVGIEVLILSTFVLISQNRQVQQAERRAKVALQVSAIAEAETTKLIEMVGEIHTALGIARDDPMQRAMQQQMSVTRVAEAIEAAEMKAAE